MNGTWGFLAALATTLFLMSSQGISQVTGKLIISDASTLQKMVAPQPSSATRIKPAIEKIAPQYTASAPSANWDWTKNVPQIIYSNLFTLLGFGSDSMIVRLPWFQQGTKIYNALGDYPLDQIDFYKQEGWVLIYKDFGTAQIPDANPTFVLYNKYRGILRIFFWNPFSVTRTDDYALVGLTITGQDSSPLFTFYPGVPQFSDQYPANYPDYSEVYAYSNLQSNAWCYADFDVTGFDDQANLKYLNFGFEIHGSTGWHVNGTTPLNEVIGGSKSSTHTALNVQISGNEPLRYAFKEVRGIQGLSQEIANNADSATTGPYKSALENLAYQTQSNSASWISNVSSLAGIVNAFSGLITGGVTGNQSSAAMPFDLQGMTRMGGSDITIRNLMLMNLFVPGSPADTTSFNPTIYRLPLGIFNVITEPTVDYCYKVSSYQANSGTHNSYVYGTPYFALDKPVELIYNPFDGLTLTSATASLVKTSGGPMTSYSNLYAISDSSFMSPMPVRIKTTSTSGVTPEIGEVKDGPQNAVPAEIALNLKFTYFDSLTSNTDTVIFLKAYPVNLKYDPSIVDRPLGTIAISDTTQSGYGNSSLPESFVLGNYPNPFNPTTNVEYQLKSTSRVNITVYNSTGQKIAVLTNGMVTAGVHNVVFDGYGFASGVYFLRFMAQPQDGSRSIVQTDKMLLLK